MGFFSKLFGKKDDEMTSPDVATDTAMSTPETTEAAPVSDEMPSSEGMEEAPAMTEDDSSETKVM